MDTLHEPGDISGDPPPITPYFARRAALEAVASERARRRGLTPAA